MKKPTGDSLTILKELHKQSEQMNKTIGKLLPLVESSEDEEFMENVAASATLLTRTLQNYIRISTKKSK